MIRFSEKETCKFVELYKRQECLWNINSFEYRRKSCRLAAFEAIAREMNLENFTASEAKAKVKILRGTYIIERAKFLKRKNFQTNLKWYSIMDSFIGNLTRTPEVNSQSHNCETVLDDIFHDDSHLEQLENTSEDVPVSASSALSESEIEQSIRSISEPEVITITPEIENVHSVPDSEFYTVVPETQSGQPTSDSPTVSMSPEILTVKASSSPEPVPVTSGIENDKAVPNSGVTTVQSGIQTVKFFSNPGVTAVTSGVQTVKCSSNPRTVYAVIPEVQTSKSVSSPNFVRCAGGSQVFRLAPENQQRTNQVPTGGNLGSRKRRHEEVTSTNSNNEVHQINGTRLVVDDSNDRNDDEMNAFGHFVALNLKKMSMHSALSAQTEILSVLSRHRLNDSAANQPQKQFVPCIFANGSSPAQKPVRLKKVFLRS